MISATGLIWHSWNITSLT